MCNQGFNYIGRDRVAVLLHLLILQQIMDKCSTNCSYGKLKNLDVVTQIMITDHFLKPFVQLNVFFFIKK